MRVPRKREGKIWWRMNRLVFFLLILQAGGCYYMQAIRGHMDVMNRRRPVEEVIQDENSTAALRETLSLVKEARKFAIDQLYLPDNDSYRSYADLQRDFVVWNVFAAPEFSLQARQWCYPVAGCVGYRGYFSKEQAERQAKRLKSDHLDVVVGGVTAYSTLGRFSDPVLNTMMRWTDLELVAVLFHELAHQRLYIRGDAEFNESYASAVEEFGVERWLASRGEITRLSEYRSNREFNERLMVYVQSARAELNEVYASSADDSEKRARKQAILAELKERAAHEADRTGRDKPGWLGSPLNNASLVPLSLYQGRLAEFRQLLTECEEDLRCFYKRAELMSEETAERNSKR